jgi:hypothetical protein
MAMKKLSLAGVAALLLATGTAHAADEALILACKGTVQWNGHVNPSPYSTGIIIDFPAQTISGLAPGKVSLTWQRFNNTTIQFSGSNEAGNVSVNGVIDRVTGDLEAEVWMMLTRTILDRYSLECKPAQKMF